MKKTYTVEVSRGAQAGTAGWQAGLEFENLDHARENIAAMIAACHEREDRGEEFEQRWLDLQTQALKAEVGDILMFDERAWRIV